MMFQGPPVAPKRKIDPQLLRKILLAKMLAAKGQMRPPGSPAQPMAGGLTPPMGAPMGGPPKY